VKGIGNQQDYGMRIYDPRLGRFLSVDPLTKTFPWYTPYQFSGNKPIWASDLDGLEENTTSTYVYHPPILGFKPAFNGIITITDARSQNIHRTFEGDFGKLAKTSKSAIGLVNSLVGSNTGTTASRLNITMTGTRTEISKSWQGVDKNYFTQFSYSISSNNGTEKESFELKSASINVSARAWDPVTFLVVNKVVTFIGIEIFAGGSRAMGTVSNAEINTTKFVYRFDTRSLDQIKAAGGFKAWGEDMNLLSHATGNGKNSGYVSTSTEEGVLENLFGSQKGYIYKIKWQENGKNVNELLGSKSPHPEELGIAVPEKIKPSDIISSKSVNQ
jgi:hypothetical protein